MTALDSILLDDSERMYNKNNFDLDLLENKRRKLFSDPKYSELLKIVIGNLTARNPTKRITLPLNSDYSFYKCRKKEIYHNFLDHFSNQKMR